MSEHFTGWLICALIVIIVMLAFLLYLNYWHQQDYAEAMFSMAEDAEVDHAKCMALVAAFVGDEFAAQVLMAAAEDYDTAEGQSILVTLSRQVWAADGPSTPSLWLRDRAETILSKTHHVPS